MQAAAQKGAYTPVVLALPPGKYTVRLENENFEGQVSIDVEVGNNERPPPAKFEGVSVEEFFNDLGW